jgi:hypothetical protein
MKKPFLFLAIAIGFATASLTAQVPQIITYQGHVLNNNTPFNGAGHFKFAFVNFDGTACYWRNDGANSTVGEPTGQVNLPVANGLFTVLLGNTNVPGMAPFPTGIFTHPNVHIRTWFSADGTTFSQLSPDPRITASGYALMADDVSDGSITTDKLAAGAVTPGKLADGAVTGAKIAPGAITSSTLADSLALGATDRPGRLDVYRTSAGTASVSILGGLSQIITYGTNGAERLRINGQSSAILINNDQPGNARAIELGLNLNSGGLLSLHDSQGRKRSQLLANDSGAAFTTYDATGAERVHLSSSSLSMNNGLAGTPQTVLLGVNNNNGGILNLSDSKGQVRSQLFADDGGGSIALVQADGDNGISLVADANGSHGGALFIYNAQGSSSAELRGAESSATGGQLILRQADGKASIQLDGEFNAGGGGLLRLYKGDGTTGITLQADVSGESKITTQVLQITGGSDLSEQFDIDGNGNPPEPGTVVCIDPEHPGKLITSARACDRTVAGVMSGAGGVKPGMLMGQHGTAADGRQPVALSGRVYCKADASHGAIRPGDLLTTSDIPGRAMRVSDYEKAHGAILGKAMSSLEQGEGLVLVLVTLQ